MTRDRRTYYLCDKECLARNQWCIKRVYTNREDYKKSLAAKKGAETTQSSNYSNDFKVTLAAMLSDDNYKIFKD